jgi:branched-subunit amino acid aminotransferase/4-amino-4-deoxychorismate lyase
MTLRNSPTLPPEPIAYFNGRWLPLSQVGVSVFDVGFLQGVTVAEQLRTFGGQLFRLDLHLERLARSLKIVGADPGLPLGELGQIANELVEQNRKLIDPADDLGATIFVTPGMSPAYAAVAPPRGATVCVHTQPLSFGAWAEKYRAGDSLVVTDVVQIPGRCWPPELKCRSRMHYYLADKKARETEAGARALLLDEQGFVTEASTANLLIYHRDEGLVSPPKEHILPGVTVAVLEELAGQLEIPFAHREMTVADVARADEVLLCSTSPCVWSVTRLNGALVADGKPGAVSQRLREAWSQMVGLDIEAQARQFARRIT